MSIIDQNKSCFDDTILMCIKNDYISNSIRKSIDSQQVYSFDELSLKDIITTRNKNADIVISSKRTLQAASNYRGKRVCILNFANAYQPGGGVRFGQTAQEESICRCSSLYHCLCDEDVGEKYYNKHKRDGIKLYYEDVIFTPNVVVFKTDTNPPSEMREDDWFNVDVISCAAPDLRYLMTTKEELRIAHNNLWSMIFKIAVINKEDVLILGALGCGVFENDPDLVSQVVADTIKDYRQYFDTIEFAIYSNNDNNRVIFEKNIIGGPYYY